MSNLEVCSQADGTIPMRFPKQQGTAVVGHETRPKISATEIYAKMNTCHFHSTDLAAPCSLYLLPFQILPESVLSCSYLLPTVKLTWLQLHLPFYFSFPSSHYLHSSSSIYHTPDLVFTFTTGQVSQIVHHSPQGAIEHQTQQSAVPHELAPAHSPSGLSKRLITGRKCLGYP